MIIQKFLPNPFNFFRRPKCSSGESFLGRYDLKGFDVRSCISPGVTEEKMHNKKDEKDDDDATISLISVDSSDSSTYFSDCEARDPWARPSNIVRKSSLPKEIMGDGDCWYEVKLRSKKNGRVRSFFYSTKTGDRVRDEPPTGASRVIYIK